MMRKNYCGNIKVYNDFNKFVDRTMKAEIHKKLLRQYKKVPENSVLSKKWNYNKKWHVRDIANALLTKQSYFKEFSNI